MYSQRNAVQQLLGDEQFRRAAKAIATYRAEVLREIAYAETMVNDQRGPTLTFTPRCERVERVKRRENPEGVGILVAWFRLYGYVVGVQVSPNRAMLWDVQSAYDWGMGDKSTLIEDPQELMGLDPVFQNPLFWYTLALTRSGEKVCPHCLLVKCAYDLG